MGHFALVKNGDKTNGYLYAVKKCVRGEISSDTFEKAGFYKYVSRRQPHGPNDAMLNQPDLKYDRVVLLRYAPGGISTKETREEMYCSILSLIGDKAHSKYPPRHVTKLEIRE